MSDQRDPLNLANLEQISPPRDAWTTIAGKVDQAEQRRPRAREWWPALAASLAVASLIGALLWDANPQADGQAEGTPWMAYSLALEQQLEQVEATRSRYRGHEALAVSELRDRLATIDARLLATDSDDRADSELFKRRAMVLSDLLSIQTQGAMGAYDEARPVVTRTSPTTLVAYEI